MSRFYQEKSYSEREAVKSARRSYESAKHYREKWLELRRVLREYSKFEGHEFSEQINKMIGIRNG